VRRTLHRLPGLVAATLFVAACDASAPLLSVVRDSAGVAIVENASPGDSAAYPWYTVAGPRVDIGRVDAADGQDLFRVAGALRLADGRFVVADGGSAELRFFDASGTLVKRAGRDGEGPGEFRMPSWLANPVPDSIFVFDRALVRVSVFDTAGVFVRAFPFGDPGYGATLIGLLPDGSFLGRPVVNLRAGANEAFPQGRQQPDILIARFNAGGSLVDTVGLFPGPERFIDVQQSGSTITSISVTTPLFGRTPDYEIIGDDLYAGDQAAPEIRVYGMDGALRRILRTGVATERVTESIREAKADRMTEGLQPEARADARAGLLAATTSEGTVPPYGEMIVSRTGELWVADYDDGVRPRGRWTVYAPDGRALARVALPARFVPFDIGADWILGREPDELDIEHVRLYAVVSE
jgi:hypothetical protein